jgi:hypothetical protein
MRRFALAVAAIVFTASAAAAQPTITASPIVANPGVAVTLTVTGTAGQSFAVIGSTTWSGFSYAGVALSVGSDVAILGTGVLNGSGQGTVSFTPPFPARDRYYVQAVTSTNGFATIVASARLTLLNNQEARLAMPIGGLIRADGTTAFLSPGVTVTKAGSVYTIDHPGQFDFVPVPIVSVTGNTTITSIATTAAQTVVTLSADGGIAFTVQSIRR